MGEVGSLVLPGGGVMGTRCEAPPRIAKRRPSAGAGERPVKAGVLGGVGGKGGLEGEQLPVGALGRGAELGLRATATSVAVDGLGGRRPSLPPQLLLWNRIGLLRAQSGFGLGGGWGLRPSHVLGRRCRAVSGQEG